MDSISTKSSLRGYYKAYPSLTYDVKLILGILRIIHACYTPVTTALRLLFVSSLLVVLSDCYALSLELL